MTPADLAYLRWSNTTIADRHAHALHLNQARNRKLSARRRREIAQRAGRASAAKRRLIRVSHNPTTESEIMPAIQRTGTMAELKRRILVGTRLRCVENTKRPELNGSTRIVVRTLGNAFVWQFDDGNPETRHSWSYYPKASGLTWLDENTFQLVICEETGDYVRLQFIREEQSP